MQPIKILAIIGSPKKSGQTIDQIKLFEQCLKEHEGTDVEYLYLSDYNLKDCIGCNLCFDKGEEYCPLKDDRDIILAKLINSDAVVFVSPIYSMHISYLLKKCLDRFSFFFHRPPFHSKKAFTIIVKGDQFKPSLKYLRSCLEQWGFDCIGSLGLPALTSMDENYRLKKMKKVKKLTSHFISEIQKNKKKPPSIMQIINFRMWQKRAEYKDIRNKDYRYFIENNLNNKKYFYEVNISKVKLLISNLIFRLLKIYIKKEMGGFENI